MFLGVCPLVAQESYYYCQGKKVFLSENKLVRYVGLKNSLTENQVKNIQNNLNECCAKIYEFTPYFAKYFILEDKMEQFNEVILNNDSLISLNSPNYASNDTLILYPARTILVKMKPSCSLLPVLDSIRVPYINVIQSKYNSQEYRISLSLDVALHFAALLYETGLFEYSQPDFFGTDQKTEYQDNPEYQYQWAVHNDVNINLLPAWNITTGHPQIKIAVLDCGVDYNHPDLTDNLLEGYDAVDDPNHPSQVCCGENESDYDYHGTCCVGIIGASNNEEGLVGISHTSKIIPIRINHTVVSYYKEQDPNNNPTPHIELIGAESWKIDAFNHACYEDKASVISCSFTTNATPAIRSKILEICQNGREGKGCVVVISSGNQKHTLPNPSNDLMGPFASQSCVISVGGINECGERMRYGHYCNIDSGYNSCYGDSLDVVAPGIHVPTTTINGEYFRGFGGTSAAAPHVAGVAALVLSVNPCLTREEVKYVIESTCTKIRPDLYVYGNDPNHPNGTWNIEVGYGLVNAGAAVALAQQMGGYTYIRDSIVTGTVVWTGNKMIHDSLVIDSLATLTVTDTIYMSSSARLIVRPGGKLVVDGGTLTSACCGELWQGIEVVGDRTKRQIPQWQGTVELKNGAVIENAHCGIRTGLGDDNWHTTGGIIKADSAFFINNRRAVAFMSYTNHSLTGVITDNVSHFTNCEFTVDNNNLFAQNNCGFIDHVTMWQVRGVKFKGCRFSNTTTVTAIGDRRHAIYTEDAGFEVTTYCRDQYYSGCECPENKSVYCEFSGFTMAIEANTTGDQHAVLVNRANFRNNGTGIKINGNHFATVIRNDFDLQASSTNMYNAGLCLNNCGGYQVEGNRFHRASGHYNYSSMGIGVQNSGVSDNSIYRNVFDNLSYGIYVTGTNGNATGGLQMLCGDFSGNGTDINLATSRTIVSPLQGSLQLSAGNTFSKAKNYNIQNMSDQSLVYFYTGTPSSSNPYYPSLRTSNVLPYLSNTANPCASTLCDGGGTPRSLAQFQSDADADTYYAAVRSLMSDTVLDLNELEQWHTAAQSANLANYANIGDPYSLAETRFMEGNAETFAGDAEDAEMANYAEFHALKLALRDNAGAHSGAPQLNSPNSLNSPTINWYSLTESQIAQLQTIAERNTGRASVMAKGVLCFFHGICYEDEWDDAGAHAGAHSGAPAGRRHHGHPCETHPHGHRQ